jgi:peptidoglycan LD-endopeptidase LytH
MQRMIKILLFSLSIFAVNQDSSNTTLRQAQHLNIYEDYKQLLVAIREENISPDSARGRFQHILRELHELYPFSKYDSSETDLAFPLRNATWRAVGGKNGSGYHVKYFDLFDASKKGSHPAHDIFMKDKNQDCIDDRYGTYVDILSVSAGLVLATETEWQPNSDYRGGNYVWVYDFRTGGLWYYAHQRKVIVQPGQRVQAGDKLGEVGRTGFNAYQKRSETHLHLMYLRTDKDNFPHPVNTFRWLQNAHTIWNETPSISMPKDSMN